MVAAADRAFVGRVKTVRTGRDGSGLPSTWVTFTVTEPITTNVGKEVTIKQIGVSEPLSDGTALRFAGVPTYKPGEEMVLFLSGESKAGFSSPIALGQGKFRILHRGNRAVVRATAENAGALTELHAERTLTAAQAVEADLDQFLSLVHRLIAEKGRQ